jgi:sulfur carrier protein ThiS
MKISVKFYGTLGNYMAGHDPVDGMVVDIPEGSTAKDLIDFLGIPRKKMGIISVDGNLAKKTQRLQCDNFVRIYPPIGGG